MFKFAKLFNDGKRQILITKSATNEGIPQLSIQFHSYGSKVAHTTIVMKDKSQGSWEELNHLFNEVNHDTAVKLCAVIDQCEE